MSDAFKRSSPHHQHHAAQRTDQYDAEFEPSFGAPPRKAAAAQAGSASKPSLSDLERMMKEAMHQINLNTAVSPAAADPMFSGDGPFDISDLWAHESQPSMSQSGSMQSASQALHSEYSGEPHSDLPCARHGLTALPGNTRTMQARRWHASPLHDRLHGTCYSDGRAGGACIVWPLRILKAA